MARISNQRAAQRLAPNKMNYSFLAPSTRFLAIPDELRGAFSPAQLALFEWNDVFFNWPRADELDVNGRKIAPLAPGLFRVRWENSVGLAKLQPRLNGQPLEAPFWVEVLSPKFPTPPVHLQFLSALLNDLFAQSARLVWNSGGQTSRGALASKKPPSPLETLDWILRFGGELEELLLAILQRPARGVQSFSREVSAAQVSVLDEHALIALTTQTSRWIQTSKTTRWNGAFPVSIPQTQRISTFDVEENRFAASFVRDLMRGLRAARKSAWWSAIDLSKQAVVARIEKQLPHFLRSIGEVGESKPHFVPRESRYHALWQLQNTFRGAGAPIFAPAQRFASTRDIASLWEFWVFFALVGALETALNRSAKLEARFDEARGLLAPSRAIFGDDILVFNGPAPSYSTPLRPDFLWFRGGNPTAAFDAKFRIEVETGSGRGADLHKMHAYRDALNIGAALAIHPGQQSQWFDRERGPQSKIPLRAILDGVASGVGLWSLTP